MAADLEQMTAAATAEMEAQDAGLAQPQDGGTEEPVSPEGSGTPADLGTPSAAPAPEGTPSTEPVADDFDVDAFLSDEPKAAKVREAVLAREEAAIAQRVKDAENTGAQRREAELRRTAGDADNVRAIQWNALKGAVETITGQMVDPALLSQDQINRLVNITNVGIQYNAENAQRAATAATAEWLAGELISPEVRTEAQRIASESPLGQRDERYFNTLREGLVEGIRAEQIKGLSLKDVSEDAPLHKEIEQEVARRLAAEIRASAATEAKKNGITAPVAPRGNTGGALEGPQTVDEWHTAYGDGTVSHKDYKEAMARFGVKLRA